MCSTRDDVGARALRLCLYRVDGAVETIDIGLTLPTRSVSHVARLIDLKLEALAATEDAGFGFEAIGLAVTCAEPMPARQTELIAADPSPTATATTRCAVLIDALRQRLGPHSVRRFEPLASHLPERAEVLAPVDGEVGAWPKPEQKPRAAAAVAAGRAGRGHGAGPRRSAAAFLLARRDLRGHRLPGPRTHRQRMVAAARTDIEAPEPTRDYYLVEDCGGHRFWLFREGLYERETAAARWFVHGMLA